MKKLPHFPLILWSLSLTLLTFLAAYLRLVTLGDKYFSIDEAFQIYAAGQHSLKDLYDVLKHMGPFQHFLDYVIDHFLWEFSPHIFSIRLLMAFWGIVTIPVVFFLGSALKDKKTGLIAAFLVTISPFHIEYSQTIRYYALIGFLSISSIVIFLKAIHSRINQVFYSIIMIFYQAVYPFALIVGMVKLLYIWIYERAVFKSMVYCLMPSWLFLLLWILMIGHNLSTPTFFYSTNFILSFEIFKTIFLRFGADNLIVSVLFFLFFLIGFFTNIKKRELLAALIIIIPIAVFLSLLSIKHPFYPRYLISIFPLCMLFIASGLTYSIDRLLKSRWVKAFSYIIITALVFQISLLSNPTKSFRYIHNAFIQSAIALRQHIGDNDVLILNNPNTGTLFLTYIDQSLLFKLSSPKIARGFLTFDYPDNLTHNINGQQFQIMTLCAHAPEMATFKSGEVPKKRAWFFHLPTDYYPQLNPLTHELGLKEDEYRRVAPGLYQVLEFPSQ